jgi:hypothetical protein
VDAVDERHAGRLAVKGRAERTDDSIGAWTASRSVSSPAITVRLGWVRSSLAGFADVGGDGVAGGERLRDDLVADATGGP